MAFVTPYRLTAQDAFGVATATSVPATYPSTPIAGNLVICAGYQGNGVGISSMADSGWTQEGEIAISLGGPTATLLAKIAGSAESTTKTFQNTGASGLMRSSIHEVWGTPPSSVTLDANHIKTAQNTTALTSTTGSVITTSPGAYIFAMLVNNGATTAPTAVDQSSNSLTMLDTNTRLATTGFVAGAAGTYSITFNWTTTTRTSATIIAAFEPTTATIKNLLIMGMGA